MNIELKNYVDMWMRRQDSVNKLLAGTLDNMTSTIRIIVLALLATTILSSITTLAFFTKVAGLW